MEGFNRCLPDTWLKLGGVYILKRVRKVRWLGLRVRVVLEGAGQFQAVLGGGWTGLQCKLGAPC